MANRESFDAPTAHRQIRLRLCERVNLALFLDARYAGGMRWIAVVSQPCVRATHRAENRAGQSPYVCAHQ